MDGSVPKLRKALLPQGPYYLPGFTGHCPGLKFGMGKPYGTLTAELLSQRKRKYPESDIPTLPPCIPDDVLKKPISGYTGFIPRSQNYFGSNYTDTCLKALTEAYLADQQLQQQSSHQPATTSCSIRHPNRLKPPQTAALDNVFLYKPLKPFVHPGNPYRMDDDDPKKYFIPGFTGHVPFSKSLFGKGFAITSNQALIEHGRNQRRLNSSELETTTHLPAFFSSKRGVVPGYTGHIPGYRFMIGKRLGKLVEIAMEKNYRKRPDHEMPY